MTGMATATLVAVVSLTVATVLLSAANRRENAALKLAQQRGEDAQREGAKAKANFQLARDTVEESIWIDGVEIRLCDAAGVREPTDHLERLGLERTSDAARRADLAVLVLDRADPHEAEDHAALAMIGERPVVVAWNKADLAQSGGSPSRVPRAQLLAEVSTVAVRPGGAESLRNALRSSLPRLSGAVPGDELPTTGARQEALLGQAVEALGRAETGLREDASHDLIAVDLTDARRALGEIVGRGVDQDVIASIFSQFCIGK
jgi:tRNA modification GTPase